MGSSAYHLDDVVNAVVDLVHRKAARSDASVLAVELALREGGERGHPLRQQGVARGDLGVLADAVAPLLELAFEGLEVELFVELLRTERELGQRALGHVDVLRAEEAGAVAGDLGAALPARERELGGGGERLQEHGGGLL